MVYGFTDLPGDTPNWHLIYNDNLTLIDDAIKTIRYALCGEPIALGDVVAIRAADGYWLKANNSLSTNMPAIGVALNAANSGAGCYVQTKGLLDTNAVGWGSLTPGTNYYVGAAANLLPIASVATNAIVQFFGKYFTGGDFSFWINPHYHALDVDPTSSDVTKNKLVSNSLAKGWSDNARRQAITFSFLNVPATGTSIFAVGGQASFPLVVLPEAGSVIGISAISNAVFSSGAGNFITMKPIIAGVDKSSPNAVLSNTAQQAAATVAKGVTSFTAGQTLGAKGVVTGTIAPTTLDMVITIWVLFGS